MVNIYVSWQNIMIIVVSDLVKCHAIN